MQPSNLLWSTDRPDFLERLAKLAGGTTYRTPGGSRSTDAPTLPDEHAIAAALSFARRGPDDIGPDVAYCWALQSDAYRRSVTRRLASAMRSHALRGMGPHLLLAADIAWDAMIHDKPGGGRMPAGVLPESWHRALLAAIGTLHRSAWDSLAEAERRYHRAA